MYLRCEENFGYQKNNDAPIADLIREDFISETNDWNGIKATTLAAAFEILPEDLASVGFPTAVDLSVAHNPLIQTRTTKNPINSDVLPDFLADADFPTAANFTLHHPVIRHLDLDLANDAQITDANAHAGEGSHDHTEALRMEYAVEYLTCRKVQKRGRRAKACLECRRRKVKCDMDRTGCVKCARNNIHCKYPIEARRN